MRLRDLESNNIVEIETLGLRLRTEFDENKRLRKSKEKEWTESLRQCKGIYDPETDVKIPVTSSKVYPKYTRYKEAVLRSIINNIILSENDKNWTIRPTKKPSVSKDIANLIVSNLRTAKQQAMQQAMEAGEQVIPEDVNITQTEFEQAVSEYAIFRCSKMEIEVEDQLQDINYREIEKGIIKSGVRYGTGVLEGPFTDKVKEVSYEPKGSGFEIREGLKHVPSAEELRVWDCYPDMTATIIDDCDFFWKRLIVNKHQLRKLAKKSDFLSDVISNFIKENPGGNALYEQWEIDIETLDKNKEKSTRKGKYELLCRWGNIDNSYLAAMGIEIKEDTEDEEMFCNVWVLGNRIIKFIKNPFPITISELKDIYHFFYFDKDETSIFGTGLPKVSRDMELTMGGAMRCTLNNAAKVSGPQTEVNIDLLAPDEDPEDVSPNRVWKRWGRGIDAQYPAVKPINFESHISELLSIFDKAMQIADLELSIPMWMHTEPEKVKEQNLGTVSTKWPLHTIAIKDIIKSYDECNESFLSSLYRWNMEFSENEDIKGDYRMAARGSTDLLMKELKVQALVFVSQTLSDEERLYIKTDVLLKKKLKMIISDDISEYMRTSEEVEQLKASMQDEEANALVKGLQKAEIIYTLAKAKHMESKADKTDKDADLEILKTITDQATQIEEAGKKKEEK